MPTQHLLYALLLGGLLGMLGQGIRMIVGLKKTYDQSQSNGQKFAAVFEGRRLALSLLIGGIAGILGTLFLNLNDTSTLSTETLSALIGLGYSGTDFIEGFVSRSVPKTNEK